MVSINESTLIVLILFSWNEPLKTFSSVNFFNAINILNENTLIFCKIGLIVSIVVSNIHTIVLRVVGYIVWNIWLNRNQNYQTKSNEVVSLKFYSYHKVSNQKFSPDVIRNFPGWLFSSLPGGLFFTAWSTKIFTGSKLTAVWPVILTGRFNRLVAQKRAYVTDEQYYFSLMQNENALPWKTYLEIPLSQSKKDKLWLSWKNGFMIKITLLIWISSIFRVLRFTKKWSNMIFDG